MERIYNDIYTFQAVDEIKKGSRVYVLDKWKHTVNYLNTLPINECFEIIADSERFKNRYLFWVERIIEDGE